MSGSFVPLLAAAARVLDAVTEKLPPLTVRMEPRPPVGSPITITPTEIADDMDSQQRAVEHLARILGTWPRPLASTVGWIATGSIGAVEVDTMAAPFVTTPVRQPERLPGDSAAAHAKLLRDLADWATALPAGVRELVVDESGYGKGFTARLVVDSGALDAVLEAHALFTSHAIATWDKYRGEGITPTGHRLTISTR